MAAVLLCCYATAVTNNKKATRFGVTFTILKQLIVFLQLGAYGS